MRAPPAMSRRSTSSWMSSGSSATSSSGGSHGFTGEYIPQSEIMECGFDCLDLINIVEPPLQLQGSRNQFNSVEVERGIHGVL